MAPQAQLKKHWSGLNYTNPASAIPEAITGTNTPCMHEEVNKIQ